ncbi:MAG: cytochrome-c peroxidase [Gammaproteobacteria bacterium]|nr:cytochrome-c peroxidase [Gammaproteobacteria bacterium]
MLKKIPPLIGMSVVSLALVNPLVGVAHDGEMFPAVSDGDYYDNGMPNLNKVELGKFLFFEKELSGNRNTSCGTCHHVLTDTGDGLSLPVGEGARGLGVTRDTGSGADAIHERVPRNAPPIFNLGAREFVTLFHDGRVQVDANQPSGFRTPAGDDLPMNLDNILAAQAMFPVTSATEMAGQLGENSIADATAIGNLAGPGGVWEQLGDRLRAIPEYVDLFVAAFDDVNDAGDITYVHAANAIAAFEAFAWRADNSAFDRYLRGDKKAMSRAAYKGLKLFYGKAGCSQCHSGVFQTDHQFHAIAMPQIGQGKGHGVDGDEDFGREAVSGNAQDRLRFRTPTLRNVALTGPWGHAGAFNSLKAVVLHHLDPQNSLENYDVSQAVLPSRPDLDAIDFVVHNDSAKRAAIASASELPVHTHLREKEIGYLMDFLHALTDRSSIDLRTDMPKYLPSGLPLAE